MKNTKRTILILAGALLPLLSSCQGISSFITKLDDEVKLANDRYLEVVGTYPEQNDNNLSPRMEILITLDRDVDPEALRDYISIVHRGVSGVLSDPFGTAAGEEVKLDFSASDNTLSIIPDPFLYGGEKVFVTLKEGATALDGSVLRDPVSWSFYTVDMPVGVVRIDKGADAVQGYTNDETPGLKVEYNKADLYYITEDQSEAENFTDSSIGWERLDDLTDGIVTHFTMNWTGEPDGNKTVYVVFQDGDTDTLSVVQSDTVFYDNTAPKSVNNGEDISFSEQSNDTITRTVSFDEPAGTQSGFQRVEWSSPDGAVFGSEDMLTTTVRGPAGDYVENMEVRARVYDRAGNSAADSFFFDWDNQPPGRPNVSVTSDIQTGDPLLSWTWTPGTHHNAQDDGPYSYRRRFSVPGGNPSYSSWSVPDAGTSTNYLASSSSRPAAVGLYVYNLLVRQYDNVGNVSGYNTSDTIRFQSVRPYYGGTINYRGRIIENAELSLDWPDYPPGLGVSEVFQVRYRKTGTTEWKYDASMGKFKASAATIPIGDISNRVGNYEWQYRVMNRFTEEYASPIFLFTITNIL